MKLGAQLRLGLAALLLLGGAPLGTFACRTSAPTKPARKVDLTMETVAEEAPVPTRYQRPSREALGELHGYTLTGPVACLPLPTGRTCLSRPSSVKAACDAAAGELLICEDCQQLCSLPPRAFSGK